MRAYVMIRDTGADFAELSKDGPLIGYADDHLTIVRQSDRGGMKIRDFERGAHASAAVGVGTATARSMVVNLVLIHVIGGALTAIFWGTSPRIVIGG